MSRNSDRRPVRSRGSSALWIAVVVVLAAAGMAAWWFVSTRPHPEIAVRALMNAVKKGDETGVKNSLTQGNLMVLQMSGQADEFPKVLQATSKTFMGKNFEEGRQYVLDVGDIKADKEAKTEIATVSVLPGPEIDDSEAGRMLKSFDQGIPFIVVKEGKGWKVDLVATYPMLIGTLQKQGYDLKELVKPAK